MTRSETAGASRLTGPLTRALRGPARLPVLSRVALGLLLLVVLAALLAPWLAPHDPYAQSGSSEGPSGDHWMGQDSLGRDILSRLLHGARWSLAIGLGATLLALVVGALIGAVAATSRRAVDETLMRSLDVVMAFPGVALAAVLISVFGGGVTVLVCAIAFLYTPPIARVVRANVLAQYGEDYVTAERVVGARTPFILVRHVAVNCAAPVLVFATVMVADAIVFEASLSFVGAGVRPPEPSWGSVIADGKNLVLLGGWWATVFPGLLMLLTVLALNILAEGASDSWAAPRPHRDLPPEVGETAPAPAGALPGPRPAERTNAEPVDDAEPAARPAPVPLPLPGLERAGARLRALARPPVTAEPVLSVRELTVRFPERHRGVEVISKVSFDVRPGEVLGLVGESGCGKSLTALTVMGLQPREAEVGGSVRFDGRELTDLSPRARRGLLGHQMAMVYQDALSSLNPAMTIRAQLRQLVRRGGRRSPAELLRLVGLDPERTLRAYPHELSGGQRQRVLIAMALSREPRLIVADEPTTALDVTIQAQVIELLLRLRAELGFALVLVSHDLALVADVTDRVVVMYGGQIAEQGVTADLVGAPAHHYTRGLLGSVLSLESGAERMTQIRGVVPTPADFPPGCRFADRCPLADAACAEPVPLLPASAPGHLAACHHPAPAPNGAPPAPGAERPAPPDGTGTESEASA
ncbi:dipeptide/oligopeptide/nickel ABC transporter permease/ATP-binding protein [Streptomyces triticirhizae]|uniref:ATP-binding cassette domain-containing protein n=1 Tax=Streptomyces triticirhizae TaxID=2483353 RepID=A0A3M2LKI5_9ACTN|nr:dipeptide/oligopeptide/nickel ABC transporter permease/ATP-binding protein [Streptomyces triticirhizae]RMI37987.1 ATP-binding cassette domain-containing protein [Streptomyces triticirhizae]